ncbi:MAG: hypothetical protein FJ088_13090, partial [Deltaproteobacteria bacterium]|nr:hypothetical protein [Deltaproteobacteria bacterium]
MRINMIFSVLLPFISASLHAGENFGVGHLLKARFLKEMEAAENGAAVLKIQDYDGKKSFTNDLYLLKSNGILRRLTYNGDGKGSFAVSPDGTRVVFYASKDGKQGLFVLPLDGGESYLLKELPVAVDNVRWIKADKSDKIFFTANVFTECAAG